MQDSGIKGTASDLTASYIHTEQEVHDKRSYLNEEPRCDEGQSTVLPVEAIMIGIEREVVQVEEPETANTVITIFGEVTSCQTTAVTTGRIARPGFVARI